MVGVKRDTVLASHVSKRVRGYVIVVSRLTSHNG